MVSDRAPSSIPEGSYFLLLKLNKEIIGSLIAEKYRKAYTIRQVAIAEDYRGKGYGRELMVHILTFLRDKRDADIILYVDPLNTVAVSLYKSLGFERVKGNTAFGDKYQLTRE